MSRSGMDMEYDPENAEAQAPPRPCCVNLRCKSLTYREDERPGLLHVEFGMGYWCCLTNTQSGPDGALVNHARCQQGRECFKPGPFAEMARGTA